MGATLHRYATGYRLLSEEICNVRYAALATLFQGQALPTEKAKLYLALFGFSKTERQKTPDFQNLASKKQVQIGNLPNGWNNAIVDRPRHVCDFIGKFPMNLPSSVETLCCNVLQKTLKLNRFLSKV